MLMISRIICKIYPTTYLFTMQVESDNEEQKKQFLISQDAVIHAQSHNFETWETAIYRLILKMQPWAFAWSLNFDKLTW